MSRHSVVKGRRRSSGPEQHNRRHTCYDEQQLHPPDARAFSLASSSSAWADHVGVVDDDKKTLSRFLSSFSCSMMSLFSMIAEISESKRDWMPVQESYQARRSRGNSKPCLPKSSFAETSNSSMPFSRPHSCSSSKSSSSTRLLLLLSAASFPLAAYLAK